MFASIDYINVIKENNNFILINKNNLKWSKLSKVEYEIIENKLKKDIKFRENIISNNILFSNEKSVNPIIDIKSIYFISTRLCNMNCSFCSMASSNNINTSDNLNFKNIKFNIIRKLKELNPKKIVISGGEPLTRKDIVEILKTIRKNLPNVYILLQTNGLLLNKYIWSEIKDNISGIEISTEHLRADNLKLEEDILEEIVNSSVGLFFSFVFDLNKNNKSDIIEVLQYGVKYESKISFRIASEIGAYCIDVEKNIAEKKIIDMYIQIIEFIIENQLKDSPLISDLIFDLNVGKSCGANGKTLTILHDGKVTICPNLRDDRFIMGNILDIERDEIEKELMKLLLKDNVKDILDVNRMKYCESCEYKFFCVGVCAGENSNGNILYDPKCVIKKILIRFNLFYYDKKKDYISNLNTLKEMLENKKKEL